MKFPGKRKNQHFFPVKDRDRLAFVKDEAFGDFHRVSRRDVYMVGIDQVLVDIEVHVKEDFLNQYELIKGQSHHLGEEAFENIYQSLIGHSMYIFAGGAVGNTLHNYSILSEDHSVILGAINKNITVGDYSYKYLCTTSSLVDLSFLQPCDAPMGRALCLVTPDKERTFVIGPGCMNDLSIDSIPEDLVAQAAGLMLSAYHLRNPQKPLYHASLKAIEIAKKNHVPVIFSMGTSDLCRAHQDQFLDFIKQNVSILAMNEDEAVALTNCQDPLLAGEFLLDLVDMVMITLGAKGLYLCAHVDEKNARETKRDLVSGAIHNFNRHEYSRAQRKQDCQKPIKIYTHINPFMGGPGEILNTNGAGDAALAALLHDLAANAYHRRILPHSPKHQASYLTYSSISQISKYCNRVSYEILHQNSPRLIRALPQKEDVLEEAYWDL